MPIVLTYCNVMVCVVTWVLTLPLHQTLFLSPLKFPGSCDHAQQIAHPLFGGIARLVSLEMQLAISGGKCDQGISGLVVHSQGTYQVSALRDQLGRTQCTSRRGRELGRS